MTQLKNALFLAAQFLLPHHLVSRLAGLLADSTLSAVRKPLISLFAKHFNISLAEAQIEDPDDFGSFNDFFTRALKPEARPVDSAADTWVSPVDGEVSQFGPIENDRVIQAKKHNFSLTTLFGGDKEMARRYDGGSFMTLYLSPSDYHRIHMPKAAKLVKTTFVPGRLYSVNQLTAENVSGLFAKNERLVCEFESASGNFTMVLVGAMIVASIETTWAGVVAPVQKRIVQTDFTSIKPVAFEKGEEMGRFRLGSTVILTFQSNQVNFEKNIALNSKIKMGEAIGQNCNKK
ncbi:archaetidylserine decarboxylase [Reinekea marinisedimentorum]|uniref:Phosphatidylserine decarboxylase proenzyme n=1 Tax=Reinekea marinisedimentorum TaxID=230495 RepID=A0A4V2UK63_9GAMM|nr:archaetidylserine decarboxylase [Reinekea marinisedimentorum]TCS43042.1 phosphatidylserine decarboxylase [Reinekea marinisedimentorum]